jgi:hypothetical protein
MNATSDQPTRGGNDPTPANVRMNPGDEAPEGTPGTGENTCPACGGTGQAGGRSCVSCGGTGLVTVGIGGA